VAAVAIPPQTPTTPVVAVGGEGVGGGGAGGGGGGPALAASVTITDNVFTPASVTIAKGGKVTWTWSGDPIYGQPHNVFFNVDGSESPNQTSGTYEKTFANAGTFAYRCTNHTGMNGTVVVQ
jgi:plastocyanin